MESPRSSPRAGTGCGSCKPEVQAILRFPLTYRGQRLEVELGPETVTYALCEGERLVIRHEQEDIPLTREQPLAIRPVSRW